MFVTLQMLAKNAATILRNLVTKSSHEGAAGVVETWECIVEAGGDRDMEVNSPKSSCDLRPYACNLHNHICKLHHFVSRFLIRISSSVIYIIASVIYIIKM
jgi:hypothetical protein